MRFSFKHFLKTSISLFKKIKDIGLKKLFYNNKMPTYVELREILKDNEIRCYSHYTKSNLIDLLIKRGLISEK